MDFACALSIYVHYYIIQIIKLDICNVKLFLLLSISISDQFPCFVTIPDTEYFIADTPFHFEFERRIFHGCFPSLVLAGRKMMPSLSGRNPFAFSSRLFFLQSKNLSRSSMQLSLSSSLSFVCVCVRLYVLRINEC